jgi:hypothetical protein
MIASAAYMRKRAAAGSATAPILKGLRGIDVAGARSAQNIAACWQVTNSL